VAGRFAEPVRMWEGATQGHEVIGLRGEGLKFETLGFDLAVLASRMPGVGSDLARHVAELSHWLDWGVVVRAEAEGRVRLVAGRTLVQWSPSRHDVARFRRGAAVMGRMFLAAGADRVDPGVRGFARDVRHPAELAALEHSGPRAAAAFSAAITHMFGTCRMSSDPADAVVRPDFRHVAVDGLYVADSSVFPTSTGVNPQIAIATLATLGAARVAGADPMELAA
jgi:choline dehydrogenase-like flavoprotein